MTLSSPGRINSLPRLKTRREFLRVARAGRKWATPGLVLQAWQRTGRSHEHSTEDKSGLASMARIGYTVTRKVGNAVIRNRAKRRLRAAADQVMPSHAGADTDFVLIGRAGTIHRPFDQLVADLRTALRKLDCYKD